MKKGYDILRDGNLNRSVEFTREERRALGLEGLLPYAVATQGQQVERVLEALRGKKNDLERYILLNSLQDRSERLFFSVVVQHLEQMMPLIYTPTVGEACQEFSRIFRRAKGFYITPEDRGRVAEIMANWPEKDVRVIVVTDGQRILGLGDLGANGMGIPIGKLALYTATAGIHPHQCMPVMLDVGTNNQALLDDPLYLGYPHQRMEGDAYFALVDEFVRAVQQRFPKALIQFEDFSTPNAYALLDTYREHVCCFNDDIQGTAAVALAGVYASTRITGTAFKDLRVMFLGAGSAATGIADLMASAFREEGLSAEEALRRLWFVDSKGLVVQGRDGLNAHKQRFAHPHAPMAFMEALDDLRPNVLIGATGSPGTFNREVIQKMAAINERPVIFALSNPTSRAECTAEEAYTWSGGRAVFTSGSPFPPVQVHGREYRPGQGNNAYIFPGIGLGAIVSGARTITDAMFLLAARTLARRVKPEDIELGSLYPRLTEIRALSHAIGTAVAQEAFSKGLATAPKPADIAKAVAEYMYDPVKGAGLPAGHP
ncbi:MAG: NAD-dependent malic enzyme [Flavobacteriales bacterium]|nr:NAD-dependent malic enzyme [Flavobacteriales bacterium]MEB2342952.1 NAD-dependent malic enzyme [Flavobacteriia bacterium]